MQIEWHLHMIIGERVRITDNKGFHRDPFFDVLKAFSDTNVTVALKGGSKRIGFG